MIRAVLTIARRDVTATIFSRGFLVWLAMPVIGLAFGIFASLMTGHQQPGIASVAIVDVDGDFAPWVQAAAVNERVRETYAELRERWKAARGDGQLPAALARPPQMLSDWELDRLRDGALAALVKREQLDRPPLHMQARLSFVRVAPDADPRAQAARLLRSDADGSPKRFGAVLVAQGDRLELFTRSAAADTDPIGRIVGLAWVSRALQSHGIAARVDQLRAERPEVVVRAAGESAKAAARARGKPLATGATMVLFVLISLLAGALLSNMVEEKSNKIIEVLVASVPVRAIFAGKLVAMLVVSTIGVAVWGLLFGGGAALALAQLPPGMLVAPARGWPELAALVFAYFVCAYLIYGAVYLCIGSLCSSIREVQTLSMPVTILQMVILITTLGVLDRPEALGGQIASWFPLSAPYMMAGRAAEGTGLAVHFAAIVWQLGFAALVIAASARLFRYGVLHSGPPPSLKQLAGAGLFKSRRATRV